MTPQQPLPIEDMERVMTPAQCAAWLGVSKRTLMNRANAGAIPCMRINRRVVRFHAKTVLATLNAAK